MTQDCRTRVAGEEIVLLPERAMYWPREATLFVADAHIGKAASFRAAGLPLPGGTTTQTLDTLERAVGITHAQRIVFLGDFLHAREGRAEATLARVRAWRAQRASLDLVLIRGNHDAKAGDPPDDLRIRVVDEPHEIAPFSAAHEPDTFGLGYTLAGHVHPAVRLNGRAYQSLRLPCFWLRPHGAVLPAFGAFTGTHVVRPARGDRVFVIAEERVVEVGQ